MVKNKRIIFFFPSHTLGGVQTLFIRLVKRLYKDGYKLAYVDFCDGTMRKALVQISELEFIDIEAVKSGSIDIGHSGVVITGFNFINLVTLYFTKNTPFLFWVLSPYNLPIKNLSRKLKVKTEDMSFFKKNYLGLANYRSALEAESVYFMDGLCFELNGEPITKYDPYIPLYLDMPKTEARYDVSSMSLDIAWVGRIDLSIKYHCVVYLIQKFESLKRNPVYENVTLTIIGGGSGSEKIKALCQSSPFMSSIYVKDSISYNKLYPYLLDNIDVVFAHGTACLESASMAIPTVCLDGYVKEFRDDYKFKWLFSREKYDIGRTEFGAEFSSMGKHLPDIIEQVKKQRGEVSELSLRVVSSQYDQDVVLGKFLSAIDRVATSATSLRVNFLTIFIDSVVHWGFVKKVFRGAFISYLKTIFRK